MTSWERSPKVQAESRLVVLLHGALPALNQMVRILLLLLSLTVSGVAQTSIQIPDFEEGLPGWKLWTRESGKGTLSLDAKGKHDGKNSARIDYQGEKDWSLEPAGRTNVVTGDIFELSGWVKLIVPDRANLILCVSTWDSQGRVQSWDFGARSASESCDWAQLKSRFIIPPGVAQIQVRVMGDGTAQAWISGISLVKEESLADRRRKDLPASFTVENPTLTVTLNSADATLSVFDKRTKQTYAQKAALAPARLLDASVTGSRIDFTLLDFLSGLTLKAALNLDAAKPEFILELDAKGDLPASVRYPGPLLSRPGDFLVVPLNEGISYPVDDPTMPAMQLPAYGGHGICMAFWGVTDGKSGQMAIIETPDDASIRIERNDGRLDIAPMWEPQKGQFGYPRRLRYVFFDDGGYVAMAKRYRAYAQQIGLFKTLEQKRKENPNVDLLIGAVNVWCWERNPVPLVKEMQAAGIDHILWSDAQNPDTLKELNDLGVLTSRYDIYQDVMNPAMFPLLTEHSNEWPVAAWPDDIVIDSHGHWTHGWEIKGKDGKMYPCGVLSDVESLKYARPRIIEDLATHPYRCRFIDTTTASSWREDYSFRHPMTRTQCREARMQLLNYVSGESKLVTGSETGHDASVPYLDYFEGMMSIAPYRVPDSGRDMQRIWNDVPENVAKFQVGYAYRLPLWELVYHDCVVAQWYWGDYNNKLPAIWDKRDLFNVLYATPPMFMFDHDLWEKNKDRFVQSYKNIAPTVRAVGYSEMTVHRFLTPDRSVQQSTFANGTAVTVNFGGQPYHLPDGALLAPGSFRVDQSAAK